MGDEKEGSVSWILNRKLWYFALLLCALLIGGGIGHMLTRSYSVESALKQARSECKRELYGNADFSQWHLNLCASFLHRLAEMELAWRRLEVENSASYSRMESDYMKWSQEWEKKLEDDRKRPSEFAGGSMEMMDASLRQYGLLCGQLSELECQWAPGVHIGK